MIYNKNSRLSNLILQGGYVIRRRYLTRLDRSARKLWYSFLGMRIGEGTAFSKLYITWPHQVQIGAKCILEENVYLKYDGILTGGPRIIIGDEVFIGNTCEFNIRKKIEVGSNSLIASGCKFIDHDHGMKLGMPIKKQYGLEKEIIIGQDVWLGVNVVVLKGITIGNGAVVAASSVVTKSIPQNEIWAGIPAKKIGERKD